ncbi:MAG: hypothetical protein IIA91_09815 [Chloroflexi bacterium]|nr:hypothetical protein [Chloroflexota bacterium]
MRIFTRVLPLALAATLFVLASACSSGGGGGGGDSVSADPLEVLAASAESFQDEVQSLEAELQIVINIGGLDIDTSAEMAYQAPDQMYLTMAVSGLGEYEMLVLGTDIYMNVPLMGWIAFSLDDVGLEELGLDAQTLQDTFSDHSLVDYAALVQSVGGEVEDLGDETIDGGTYRHYRGTVEFADLSAAFNDTVGASEDLNLDDISGPLTFDVWVDTDSYLPYKLTAGGEFDYGVDAMVFNATMLFTSYNEPVEIPDAPQEVVSLGELFSGLFDGLEGLEGFE